MAFLISAGSYGYTFAEKKETDAKTSTVAEQAQIVEEKPEDNGTKTYVINNRLFITADDAMAIAGFSKNEKAEYVKENMIVSFDAKTHTMTINSMPKILKDDIIEYDSRAYISTAAVETVLGKALTSAEIEIKYNVLDIAPKKPGAYAWTENRLVAHALGGINGVTNTNTIEAMKESYRNNFKLFEVDLLPTADGSLVASHSFYELLASKYGTPIPGQYSVEIPSSEEFLSFNVKGMYKPMDLKQLVSIMSANPDIYMITDTKITDAVQAQSQFKEIVRVCKEIDESVLSRIIPQIYNEQMYDVLMNEYPFKSIVYTLYATSSTNQQALQFVTSKGMKVVVIPPERLNEEDLKLFNSYGIKVYTHTINDQEEMKRYLNMGVYGFYTDFISPSQFDMIR